MVKTALLVASALMLTAAAPNRYGSLTAPLAHGVTVTPERRSGAEQLAGGGFTLAPLPDIEASAPIPRSLGPAQAKFAPRLFRAGKLVRGDGYVAGSTVEGDEQKHFSAAPGINMSVPLQ